MRSDMKANAGFTLIELIVGITITAILAAISVPSFLLSVRNHRGVSDANGILAAATLARSEAIKRDSTVVLCTSSTGTSCASSGSWNQGFMVFVDVNNDGAYTSGTDILLRTEVPLSASSTINLCSGAISTSTGTALVSLSFIGTGQTTTQAYFDVNPATTSGAACPASTVAKATGERYVVIRQIGRANVCNPTDSNCGQ